jgi:putative acetyltransferase
VQKAGLRPVGARIDESNEHVLQWLVSRPPSGWHARADPAQPAGATMPIAVVPITLAHVESFRACLDAVARERRYLAQTEALPLERIAAFVRDSVANHAAQYVALEGDLVVGWCDVFPAWADAVRHSGSLGMGVLASHRGRGIGRQLLAATLAHARASGITRVELEVRADNVGAIRLYERLGFVHEGRKRHGMRFDGAYFDSLSMGLVFVDA